MPTSPVPKDPERSPGTRAQRRIEAAAIRLFSETGSHRVTVLELAAAAGVARGTVYAHVESTEALFEGIASRLASEMHYRVRASLEGQPDPAIGLAHDLRFFVRRAHEERSWGWFVHRFALSHDTLRDMLHGGPARAIERGRRSGRYRFREALTPSVMAMIAGTTLTAMYMVLEGHQTWRDAGSSSAELILRAVGVSEEEANQIACMPLPELVSLDNQKGTSHV